ncbi:single-stranded DNA-binding protein [Coraliomargarita algicola]|uniref:Single-stranded DNA-binding protein n=1 Tax=Coraliomargarita algicola TaxID=3092156 RepID=A0ABZ0RRG9_9BACT|nr:single-stranded DNA-binding protein [Coraliomargarita sp. J2-16]WPJ98082.1 single-stranded DNA-binding protein [Coraliomargarita sp. J2-16]
MNQTIISGHLTADIETRKVGEQHLSKFRLACNEGERVVFMPVEAWNMPHLAEHLFKGSKVLLSGGLKQESWETDAGEPRSRIVLTAYKVEFLDSAPSRESHSHPQRGPQRGRDTRRTRSQNRPSRSAA